MKLLECTVHNFGSYNDFTIDFSNLGLSLFYGPTGSGKSTIPNMPFWIMFGHTAKAGKVDDVRTWLPTEEPTVGSLTVDVNGIIKIVRIRGKSSQNDLYWYERDSNEKIRGKDITDTQKLLNRRLGLDANLYATAAYYHEFSPTASFFVASAKDQRKVFEDLADLSTPVLLDQKLTEKRKLLKVEIAKNKSNLDKALGRIKQLEQSIEDTLDAKKTWDHKKSFDLGYYRGKVATFESDKALKIEKLNKANDFYLITVESQLHNLLQQQEELLADIQPDGFYNQQLEELKEDSTKCPTCGSSEQYHAKYKELTELERINQRKREVLKDLDRSVTQLVNQENKFTASIAETLASECKYVLDIERLEAQENPMSSLLQKQQNSLSEHTGLLQRLEDSYKELDVEFDANLQLTDLSFDLRALLLRTSINQIQEETNRILHTYFDSEISVQFSLEGSDGLEVTITKNGYACSYRQLSKGQCGLLKLSFTFAVMQAASQRQGVEFSNLFFDEALDGLDSDLKVKAFTLFEEASTRAQSVVLIDHAPEFQNLFSEKYHVSLEGDLSQVHYE